MSPASDLALVQFILVTSLINQSPLPLTRVNCNRSRDTAPKNHPPDQVSHARLTLNMSKMQCVLPDPSTVYTALDQLTTTHDKAESTPCTVPPGSLTSSTEPNGDQADTAFFSMCLWLSGKPTRSKLLLRKPSNSLQIILLLSGQISPNPGPLCYPFVECGKAVRTNQKGLQCDDCLCWCHSTCIGRNNNTCHTH